MFNSVEFDPDDWAFGDDTWLPDRYRIIASYDGLRISCGNDYKNLRQAKRAARKYKRGNEKIAVKVFNDKKEIVWET